MRLPPLETTRAPRGAAAWACALSGPLLLLLRTLVLLAGAETLGGLQRPTAPPKASGGWQLATEAPAASSAAVITKAKATIQPQEDANMRPEAGFLGRQSAGFSEAGGELPRLDVADKAFKHREHLHTRRSSPLDNSQASSTLAHLAGHEEQFKRAPHAERQASANEETPQLAEERELELGEEPAGELPLAEAQVAPLSPGKGSELSAALASQQQAFALAQEANKAASKLNAELCRNFSIGLQDERGGAFTSPNYPNPYPLSLICTRLIEAPVGHYIVLEFRDQFNIEEAGNDCDNDKIEIRDGRYGYSKVLARYCGSKFPPEVKSSNEAMWLRFISDASISNTGFRAVYRFERQKNIKPNPPFECRFNVTAMPSNVPNNNNATNENRTGIHSGVIRNSDVPDKLIDYTKTFNVSLECIWNITVMPGWKIYLIFSVYELNKPNDCDANFIEIYEDNLTEENQTVKFCGTRTEPQQSKSNVFNIRHHALPTAPGSRFEIIYTAFRDKGTDGCDAREFDCDDGTCIHESLKCDGQVNCKYRYDEASDPGPCVGNDSEGNFFETEHMVIILIVFLALVSGMCASIVVSCWGKIQERRRRKLEYHMRKSREASVEGQLNKAEQLYSARGQPEEAHQTQLKQRLAAANSQEALAAANRHQGTLLLNGQRFLAQNGAAYSFQPQMVSLDSTDAGLLANYGLYNAANSSMELKAEQQPDHHMVNKSLQNVQQSILASMAQQQQQQQQKQLAQQQHQNQQQQQQQVAEASANKQHSVPDNSLSNQFKLMNAPIAPGALLLAQDSRQQQQQQQMLNLSLARNLSQQQQQQQKYIGSIYQSQQHALDDNSGKAGHYGRFLRGAQHQDELGACEQLAALKQAVSGAQTLPLGLVKYNLLEQQQADSYEGRQQHGKALKPQHALTLSSLHQPQVYASQTNALSSSTSCCNALVDYRQPETPLISDLVARANQQQRLVQLQAPGERLYELRSWTMRPQAQSGAMPRSVSAHQLSKRQAPAAQQQLHQLELLRQQQQIQHQHHQAPPYKSMSDAGHAARAHQPPNHSLSYPHACTGAHEPTAGGEPCGRPGVGSSPGLPPPPPPPNLAQVGRPSTSCGSMVQQQQQQQQAGQQVDSRRAAFKVSRLSASQLTGDTLQDPELLLNLAAGGQLPFTDEASSESDATMGLLMNSVGNTPLNLSGLAGLAQNANNANLLSQQKAQQQQQLMLLAPHLSECNLVRRQRAQQPLANANQAPICDCGALERAEQLARQRHQQHLLRHQQLHQVGSTSRELDDSDDTPYLAQSALQPHSPKLFANLNASFSGPGGQQLADGGALLGQNIHLGGAAYKLGGAPAAARQHSQTNGSLYGSRLQQQQQFARFRHQSSELTAEDEDEEDEDELDGYQVEADEEEEEPSSEGGVAAAIGGRDPKQLYSVARREEQLRDGPAPSSGLGAARRQLAGSHTSLSCQSCTCGSQLQLDQLGAQEDEESSNSTTTNELGADSAGQQRARAPASNQVPIKSSGQQQQHRGPAKPQGEPGEGARGNQAQEAAEGASAAAGSAAENCDTSKTAGKGEPLAAPANKSSQPMLNKT